MLFSFIIFKLFSTVRTGCVLRAIWNETHATWSLLRILARLILITRPIYYIRTYTSVIYTYLGVENWINFEFTPCWYIFDLDFAIGWCVLEMILRIKNNSVFCLWNISKLHVFKIFHAYNFIKLLNFSASLFYLSKIKYIYHTVIVIWYKNIIIVWYFRSKNM